MDDRLFWIRVKPREGQFKSKDDAVSTTLAALTHQEIFAAILERSLMLKDDDPDFPDSFEFSDKEWGVDPFDPSKRTVPIALVAFTAEKHAKSFYDSGALSLYPPPPTVEGEDEAADEYDPSS